jgi:hypothetical protein
MGWHSRDDWIGASFAIVVVIPILASVVTACGVIAWQCLEWLRLAVWPAVTLRDGLSWWSGRAFRSEVTEWLGVDQIVQWMLDGLPLVLWLAVILPVVWFGIGTWVFNCLFLGRRPPASPS